VVIVDRPEKTPIIDFIPIQVAEEEVPSVP
jgi:hypothetical protein